MRDVTEAWAKGRRAAEMEAMSAAEDYWRLKIYGEINLAADKEQRDSRALGMYAAARIALGKEV